MCKFESDVLYLRISMRIVSRPKDTTQIVDDWMVNKELV